jgi:hypothetical protein
MTSVLFSGGLNYQRNNPLQSEIRGLRREIEEVRGLIKDLHVRLDRADIPALPEEETVAFQLARAAEAAAAAAASANRNTFSASAAAYARRG